MTCPTCKREHAHTLSICPSCGAMANDTVREELAARISPISQPLDSKPLESKAAAAANSFAPISRTETSQIISQRTSPTLIGFQNDNAVLPDWRLRLQNSVRMRLDKDSAGPSAIAMTDGANALQPDELSENPEAPVTNAKLESALKRIEESRRRFEPLAPVRTQNVAAISTSRSFAFSPQRAPLPAVRTNNYTAPASTEISRPLTRNPHVEADQPAQISSTTPKRFNTNRLPALPSDVVSEFDREKEEASVGSFKLTITGTQQEFETEEPIGLFSFEGDDQSFSVRAEESKTGSESSVEIDDCAPFALRFNAGLFDLIIGSFISLVLLIPFTFASGSLFTFPGFVAFLATDAIVMFIYLTVTIGHTGRTPGMRMFSLEIVDVDENAYPTFHQAAVSSSVYLLSLATLGLGFLTMFLNVERRAAHDLLSGTIIVREY